MPLAQQQLGEFAAIGGDAPALAQRGQRIGCGRQMHQAQLVSEDGKAHCQRSAAMRGSIQRVTQVDLAQGRHPRGVAPVGIHLGQQPRQRTAVVQHVKHARGVGLHQSARELLPHPFGHQRIGLAGIHHLAHQRRRFGCDAEVVKAGCKARQSQDAHGVFGEGGRHVAQQPSSDIALPSVRIDELAVSVHGHGVDGEVAPLQVLLERDVGCGVKDEAVVARRGAALGARQRVFLFRARVQEDRKVAPDRGVSSGHHLLGAGAGDDPVGVAAGTAQQRITHRAADLPDLHRSGPLNRRGRVRAARRAVRNRLGPAAQASSPPRASVA